MAKDYTYRNSYTHRPTFEVDPRDYWSLDAKARVEAFMLSRYGEPTPQTLPGGEAPLGWCVARRSDNEDWDAIGMPHETRVGQAAVYFLANFRWAVTAESYSVVAGEKREACEAHFVSDLPEGLAVWAGESRLEEKTDLARAAWDYAIECVLEDLEPKPLDYDMAKALPLGERFVDRIPEGMIPAAYSAGGVGFCSHCLDTINVVEVGSVGPETERCGSCGRLLPVLFVGTPAELRSACSRWPQPADKCPACHDAFKVIDPEAPERSGQIECYSCGKPVTAVFELGAIRRQEEGKRAARA